jgi:hypothetical protein
VALFNVRHPLNPSKLVTFGVTFRQVVDKAPRRGEAIWVMEVGTIEKDINGNSIPVEIVNLTSLEDMDKEMRLAVSRLAQKVNWEPFTPDTRAPFVEAVSPSTYTVDIYSNLQFVLKDLQPSAGIDFNSIQLTINGVDASSSVEVVAGDEYECTLEWRPPYRVFETFVE